MEYFDKAIYWISSGLLIPVMVAIAWFLTKGLLLIGQFYGFYIDRLKYNKQLNVLTKDISFDSTEALNRLPLSKSLLSQGIRQLMENHDKEILREKILADFEVSCEKDLDKSRTLSKMGPMLGLMGTLIPMGPALSGLAAGDLATMSQQMQIAFNTTVMGLLIGGIGYLTLQTKQRWYAQDLNQMDFINNTINESHEEV